MAVAVAGCDRNDNEEEKEGGASPDAEHPALCVIRKVLSKDITFLQGRVPYVSGGVCLPDSCLPPKLDPRSP